MDGTSAADAALANVLADVINIVLGTVFLTVGGTACAIAAIRWRRGVRILVWWGIFSGLYGLQKLGQTPTILMVLPHYLKSVAPYVNTAVMYLLLISALVAWRELALGKLRLFIEVEIFAGSAIALVGIGTFALGGPTDKWMFYNNLLAVLAMLVLLAVVLVPKFSKFLVMPNHRVLAAGTLIFALEVLYTNLGTVLQYRPLPLVDSLGFAVILFSLGYVALEIVFTNERRLLSIETELETARQIQFNSSGESSRASEPPYRCDLPSHDRRCGRFLPIRPLRQPSGHPCSRRLWTWHPGGAHLFDDQSGHAVRLRPRS